MKRFFVIFAVLVLMIGFRAQAQAFNIMEQLELSGEISYLPRSNAVTTGTSMKFASFVKDIFELKGQYAYILSDPAGEGELTTDAGDAQKHLFGAGVFANINKSIEAIGGTWQAPGLMPQIGVSLLWDVDLGSSKPVLAITMSIVKVKIKDIPILETWFKDNTMFAGK